MKWDRRGALLVNVVPPPLGSVDLGREVPSALFLSFKAQGFCGIAQRMFLDLLVILDTGTAGKRGKGLQLQRATVWDDRACPCSETAQLRPFYPLMCIVHVTEWPITFR